MWNISVMKLKLPINITKTQYSSKIKNFNYHAAGPFICLYDANTEIKIMVSCFSTQLSRFQSGRINLPYIYNEAANDTLSTFNVSYCGVV